MRNLTWNRFPIKNLLIDSLLTPIVESTYLNTSTSVADSENQIKKGHRNLESQQNDNIPRSVGATSLKQEKVKKRSKSTKCYVHFSYFPESSSKKFYIVSHLHVSQIPKIKSKKAPELAMPAEWPHIEVSGQISVKLEKSNEMETFFLWYSSIIG